MTKTLKSDTINRVVPKYKMNTTESFPLSHMDKPEHHQGTLFDVPETLMKEYSYQQLDDVEVRTKYVRHTEKLIANLIADEDDYVVFLDKSARPVAWLMKSLWPMLGVDDDGNPARMPEIRFANIDREQWSIIMGRSTDKEGGAGISGVPQSTIDDLSDTFSDHNPPSHNVPDINHARIRIVDEVMASGDTIRMATGLFQRAFPEAEVHDIYWMTPETKVQKRDGARYNAELPVWYKDNDMRGRLVADRNIRVSEKSPSTAQRQGAVFLSTRFSNVDQAGVALKHEMEQLAHEVSDGKIPVTPSSLRSFEAQEYILNHVDKLSIQEYAALKKETEHSGEPFVQLYQQYKLDRLKRVKRKHPSASRDAK